MQIQHFFICFTETVLIWILDYNIQNPAGYLNQNKTEQKKSWDDRESTKDGGEKKMKEKNQILTQRKTDISAHETFLAK